MAICNLFSELTNNSGNFLMFSQYVEDITRGFSEGDNYKIIPSKFIAFDINYANIDIPDATGDLNVDIPNFFQNYLENAAAYNRGNEEQINSSWSPTIFKNMFWNYMFNHGFLTPNKLSDNEDWYVNELVHANNINMHSYNEHQGLGYGEIYCYIPTDAKRQYCNVIIDNNQHIGHLIQTDYLEGFENNEEFRRSDLAKQLSVYRNNDHNIEISDLQSIILDETIPQYNINTIVVLYSICKKNNDEWIIYNDCEDIPMGIYFTGLFNGTDLTNNVTKFVDSEYDTGTSYGLRICTRFTATSNGKLINKDVEIHDSTQDSNLCQLMTAMSDNISHILEITKSNISTSQEYKDTLTKILNDRNNIPYVRRIGDEDYWFVNGKLACPTKIYITKPIDAKDIQNLNYNFTWNN